MNLDGRESIVIDCAVIGAGLAGLVAAKELRARGLSVVVLEARDRVGGRIENVDLDDGTYLELGAQYIGPGFDLLMELVEEYGLTTIDQPNLGGKFLCRESGVVHEVESEADLPKLNPFELSDFGQGLLRLRRLARRSEQDETWRDANEKWLSQSLRRWAKANFRTVRAQERFAEVYESAFGPLTEDTSLEEGLAFVRKGPDLESLQAVNGRLVQLRIEGGMWALPKAMADELGDIVRLSTPVRTIQHDENSAVLTLESGETIEAGQVIVTLPPRLSIQLDYDPPLPQWRAEYTDKVSPGNVIKAFLLFDKPFWRERGLSGQSSADEGAVRVTFDTTVDGSKHGSLLGFIVGAEADSLSKGTAEMRERAFYESVEKTFGNVPKPVAYVERDWYAEEYTQGCHGAHFSPGIWSAVGAELGQSEGVIHWAGSEYATKLNGYLEGAVHSAKMVAAKVAIRNG